MGLHPLCVARRRQAVVCERRWAPRRPSRRSAPARLAEASMRMVAGGQPRAVGAMGHRVGLDTHAQASRECARPSELAAAAAGPRGGSWPQGRRVERQRRRRALAAPSQGRWRAGASRSPPAALASPPAGPRPTALPSCRPSSHERGRPHWHPGGLGLSLDLLGSTATLFTFLPAACWPANRRGQAQLGAQGVGADGTRRAHIHASTRAAWYRRGTSRLPARPRAVACILGFRPRARPLSDTALPVQSRLQPAAGGHTQLHPLAGPPLDACGRLPGGRPSA